MSAFRQSATSGSQIQRPARYRAQRNRLVFISFAVRSAEALRVTPSQMRASSLRAEPTPLLAVKLALLWKDIAVIRSLATPLPRQPPPRGTGAPSADPSPRSPGRRELTGRRRPRAFHTQPKGAHRFRNRAKQVLWALESGVSFPPVSCNRLQLDYV